MIENLCQTCKFFKPRNVKNCQIQQTLYVNDIIKEICTTVITCKKYQLNENKKRANN